MISPKKFKSKTIPSKERGRRYTEYATSPLSMQLRDTGTALVVFLQEKPSAKHIHRRRMEGRGK
jgi:hypothetical protein